MARIVSNFFISMDGVVERPDQWHFPYFDDEMGRVVGSGMETQQTFLMGHRLYGEWSAYWPGQGDEVPFASHINQMPKYVLSHEDFEPTCSTSSHCSCTRSPSAPVSGSSRTPGPCPSSSWRAARCRPA
ncbi:hypothetical protein GCM10009844_20110 [Nocardioides koreensis]|uniref:Bacterial bifunctional deaminase-reductase C-terminal domain-containing protein n=1 Tax=Nocardioides koreensis TaxID=433651 RepID=A0ABN2ZPI2_9ACTN